MALCEVALSDGSDLVAKEMEFGQGWNSPYHTKSNWMFLENFSVQFLGCCVLKLSWHIFLKETVTQDKG